MKLWKGVVLAVFVLLSAVLALLLARTMPTDELPPPPVSTLSKGLSPLPLKPRVKGHRRMARAADGMTPLLSEFSYLFQSFTEGELQKVIEKLVDRKVTQESSQSAQSRRTKRARKGPEPCSLHEVHLTVREFGLGYDSDEIVPFRYCSGKCTSHRRHYDMVMEHMRLGGASGERGKGKGRAKSERYSPCCRPIKYEKNLSFFTNNNSFFTIDNVSAKKCGCV